MVKVPLDIRFNKVQLGEDDATGVQKRKGGGKKGDAFSAALDRLHGIKVWGAK